MGPALIIFTDAPDGSVDVQVKLGPAGLDDDSQAHALAVQAMAQIAEMAAPEIDASEGV